MPAFVLDASAVLRFSDNEPGADRVRELIVLGTNKQADLYMSPVNWGEVVHYALRTRGSKRFAEGLKATLPVTFPQIDVSDAGMAAEIKFKSKLAYADAFAASLAEKLSATLVTADYDFKVLSSRLQIEFLPQKP